MNFHWDQPLGVGFTDRYSVVPSDEWLDGEIVTSATVSVPDASIVTHTPAEISGSVISALFTGVSIGYVEVTVNYSTATRSGCVNVMLVVKQC